MIAWSCCLSCSCNRFINERPVGRLDGSSQRVHEEFFGDAAEESLILFCEFILERCETVIRFAAGKHAADFDAGTIGPPSVQRFFAIDLGSPLTDDIEVFKCQTIRINSAMTIIAGHLFTMPGQSLTDGQFFAADIRFYFTSIRRWRRRWIVEKDVENVLATFNRLGAIAVAAPSMESRHAKQPATNLSGRWLNNVVGRRPVFAEFYSLKGLAADSLNAVVSCKSFVGDRPVRIEQIQERFIFRNDLSNHSQRLFEQIVIDAHQFCRVVIREDGLVRWKTIELVNLNH